MIDKLDYVGDLIVSLSGLPGKHLLAAIDGNIDESWYSCDLTAHRMDPTPSNRVAVFCSAKMRGKSAYSRAAGAKVVVEAGSPEADLMKIADALAEQLRSRISAIPRSEGAIRISLAEGAVMPERKTDGASGYDLCAMVEAQIQPGRLAVFDTGVTLEMPVGMEAQIRPRSGLASRGIVGTFGTVDSDYRSSVRVILTNQGTEAYTVRAGDRIAQMMFARVELPKLEVVDITRLSKTERGTGGFGSTGR